MTSHICVFFYYEIMIWNSGWEARINKLMAKYYGCRLKDIKLSLVMLNKDASS